MAKYRWGATSRSKDLHARPSPTTGSAQALPKSPRTKRAKGVGRAKSLKREAKKASQHLNPTHFTEQQRVVKLCHIYLKHKPRWMGYNQATHQKRFFWIYKPQFVVSPISKAGGQHADLRICMQASKTKMT